MSCTRRSLILGSSGHNIQSGSRNTPQFPRLPVDTKTTTSTSNVLQQFLRQPSDIKFKHPVTENDLADFSSQLEYDGVENDEDNNTTYYYHIGDILDVIVTEDQGLKSPFRYSYKIGKILTQLNPSLFVNVIDFIDCYYNDNDQRYTLQSQNNLHVNIIIKEKLIAATSLQELFNGIVDVNDPFRSAMGIILNVHKILASLPFRFTHYDLNPDNILIKNGKIIIDNMDSSYVDAGPDNSGFTSYISFNDSLYQGINPNIYDPYYDIIYLISHIFRDYERVLNNELLSMFKKLLQQLGYRGSIRSLTIVDNITFREGSIWSTISDSEFPITTNVSTSDIKTFSNSSKQYDQKRLQDYAAIINAYKLQSIERTTNDNQLDFNRQTITNILNYDHPINEHEMIDEYPTEDSTEDSTEDQFLQDDEAIASGKFQYVRKTN